MTKRRKTKNPKSEKNFNNVCLEIIRNWPCDFCHPYESKYRCRGTLMCPSLAGYEECKIRGRTAAVCKDMVRPPPMLLSKNTPLQDRIVKIVELREELPYRLIED